MAILQLPKDKCKYIFLLFSADEFIELNEYCTINASLYDSHFLFWVS